VTGLDLAPTAIAAGPAAPRRTGWLTTVAVVYGAQLARVRVARGPLLFVATLQSLGIVLLLRGVVHHHDVTTGSVVVAGSVVLVVAFVALNLLAQRFGALKASRALDYYAALPIAPSAVVLGAAASYATVAFPGAVVTAVVGTALYGLAWSQLWLVVPTVVVAGVALSGVGAVLGLAAPRSELATVAGQLAMTAVLFLGVIPAGHLPQPLRALRYLVPSSYPVDALATALHGGIDPAGTLWRFAVAVGYGALALALAGRLLRWAVRR
jgi:ABC-2 type transport system permease protein